MKNIAFAILVTLWPLVRKELVAYARDRRSQILFAASFIVAAAAAFLFYAYGSASLLRRAGRSGGAGPTLFEFFSILQILFVAWFVPHVLARRVACERETGTLLLLRSALLDVRQIILTKFSAALMCSMLFVSIVAPFYGLVLLLGGVDVVEIFVGLCIIIFTAVLSAAVARWIAESAASVGQAEFGTAVFAAVLTLGLPLATALGFAMARQLFGPIVRSGSWSLFAAAIELLLGLLESIGPVTALLDGREYYAATGNLWTFQTSVFATFAGPLLPAPFLTVVATHGAATVILLRRIIRRR